jgi:hypothetical protein
MCDVSSTAVLCIEDIECLPSVVSRYSTPSVKILVAPRHYWYDELFHVLYSLKIYI